MEKLLFRKKRESEEEGMERWGGDGQRGEMRKGKRERQRWIPLLVYHLSYAKTWIRHLGGYKDK